MKKKGNWVTWIVIISVLIIALIIMSRPGEPPTDKATAQCIGENSVLYVQLGCPHCETQEEMFGSNKKYLEIIDCFYQRDQCEEISATPTWLINGEYHEGVQSIEKLKSLTNC